jgi:hypothetical protein
VSLPVVTREEIESERQRQDAQWGGPAHDDRLAGWEWQRYILKQAQSGNLLQTAALGFAVADALDRARAELAQIRGEEE